MTTDLVPVDKTAASVVTSLENAKTWLTAVVGMTGPEEILTAKAHVRTAETYARELRLSKDIQQDAQELVRRFEYELERAIRAGKEAGTISSGRPGIHTPGVRGTLPRSPGDLDDRPSPRDFFTSGAERSEVYQIGHATPEQFEAALGEARAEGELTRANVVRKVKQQTGPTTRDQRADLIEDLAQQGYSSRQMPVKVGVTEESVRLIARDYGITIPADRVKSRRIDSTQLVENTATALEGLVMGVELIDYEAVDPVAASQWADSLTESMRALNRFVRKIKEQTHD